MEGWVQGLLKLKLRDVPSIRPWRGGFRVYCGCRIGGCRSAELFSGCAVCRLLVKGKRGPMQDGSINQQQQPVHRAVQVVLHPFMHPEVTESRAGYFFSTDACRTSQQDQERQCPMR